MKKVLLHSFLVLFFIFSFIHCSAAAVTITPAKSAEAVIQNGEIYWPVSTPEEQGIDSANLLKMVETIKKENRNIHSILIVKGGKLLFEAYFDPFNKNSKHCLYSATKSMSSLLIGIALQEGMLKSVNTPIMDIFPEYIGKIANLDDRKKSLTLNHLLTMTDGLDWIDWPYRTDRHGDFMNLMSASDSVKYYLDKPIKETMGGKFNYNSGSSYMLSAIIKKATGKNALQFGLEKLFHPLGIIDIGWGKYHGEICNGASELYLTPRDWAKIGRLLLNKGQWRGKTILSAEWVDAISREQVKSDLPQYGYSFQWYINETLPEKNISAQGLGGQCLFVVPGRDMVIVFTGGLIKNNAELDIPFFYLRDFILPAIKSAKPLPANPQLKEKLDMLLAECEHPRPKPPAPLPLIAKKISGQAYVFSERNIERNLWGLETVSLSFSENSTCLVKMSFAKNVEWFSLGFDAVFRSSPGAQRLTSLESVAGLDDVFRTVMIKTDTYIFPYSAKGRWKDEKTFEVTSLSGWNVPEVHTFEFQTENIMTYTCQTIFYELSLRGEKK